MNQKQRENTAKYFYDISKGIALATIVGNLIAKEPSLGGILWGIATSGVAYLGAYYLDEGENDD